MACGAPVVARRTPYNDEVLANEAYLVEPDHVAIESAIRRMLTDGAAREEAGSSNRNRAAKHYNWPDVCGAYENVLRQLLSAPNQKESSIRPADRTAKPASGTSAE